MASPFSAFRKHQKFLMATACLLAIIAFVFLPNMSNLVRKDSKGRENLIVVKTKKFGDLQQSDLDRLRRNRQKVRAVLIQLNQAAGQRSVPVAVQRQVQEMTTPVTVDALVDTWLRVRRAEEMGMVVSDDTITRFLETWTANRVKIADIQAAFKSTPAVTDAQFYNLLRDELLARQLRETFEPSLAAATPSQRWDWYNRLNCRAVIEAVPLPVANYVEKVGDPTDEVLKKFFEEHKGTLPDPTSPKPGFRRPQKVALEYFKAEVDKFAATVTDAEVQERYEKNEDFYDRLFKIPSAEPPTKQGAAKDTKDAKKASETKPKQEPKATKDVPKAKTPVEPKKEPNKTKDSKGASSAVRPSPFMLTAMQQAEKSADKPPKPPATPEPSAKAKLPVKPEPPAKPESPVAKPEKPAAKEQKPAAKGQKPAAKGQKPAAKPVALEPEEPSEEVLKAMKARIRRDLALEKIVKTFKRFQKPMEEYQQQRSKYDLLKIQREHEKKKVPLPPPSLDFEKMAKEVAKEFGLKKGKGLSAGSTKLISRWEALDSEIGRSMVGGNMPVCVYVYQTLRKFSPVGSCDSDAAFFFWKTDEAKEDSPKLDEKGVREEVLNSWKMIQARKLAMNAAKSLAGKANTVAKPLKHAFKTQMDLRVVLPPKFSWMTLGNVAITSQQQPLAEISTVPGVPMVGDDFMETVFRLQPGHVGVAFNAPQTVVYVVRPSEFTPLYEVRWKMFLVDSLQKYASAGYEDQRRTFHAWLEEIKKSAGFEWGPGHETEQAMESDRTTEREQPPMDDEE